VRAYSYWNAERDVCVIKFERPVESIGQAPFNAVNHALSVFYNQSEVCDPYPMTIWDTPSTQWGIMVSESMNLSDEAAYALASSIVNMGDSPPYDTKTWEF
jgi:hypothetical protein